VKFIIESVYACLPDAIRVPLMRAPVPYDSVREITLRVNRPVCIETAGGRYSLTRNGCLTDRLYGGDLTIADKEAIGETFLRLCDYSVYARQDELNSGYLTVDHGVRVGVCGTAVMKDGAVSHIKDISTLSFRIPREVIGCADELLRLVDAARGVLICGAPCSGKTTLIRDMARQLSYYSRVTLIDERGELSASRDGTAGYDIGFCDVFLSIPKVEGILRAVRSLSPDIIVCDELGDERELSVIRCAVRCGAAFIATIHAADLFDLRMRPAVRELMESGVFRYLVFLDGKKNVGRIRSIDEWSPDA
jgi:stage III sporulation protein AA